jgi:tripartite-type tricarboxylate transporter receptor subunit TctC
LALGVFALIAIAHAEEYPSRPVRLIVSSSPGSGVDIVGRIVAQRMSEILATPIVVDNRAGAGGNIAAEAVARTEPDGYTLILATSSTHATNAALYKRLGFNPVRDFTPISQIAFIPNLLVVNPDVPVNSVAELVAYAKARPGQLNYGSGGAGTSLHLAAAVFAYRAGIDMVHVPYRGGAPVAADLVSGKIQVSFSPLVEVLQQVRAGKLRALGVTTARRSALLPEVPAISEVIPGYEVALWNGIMGPAGLPAPVVARLASEIVAIVGSPEMRSRLAEQGSDPVGSTPQEFAAFVAAEQPKWAELVRISGATVD